MATTFPVPLPPPSKGKLITVLSIDGGGVKGIIPSVILAALEKKLQDLDGAEARLADYFDVVAGTSTGGLVLAMVAGPDPQSGRPLLAAKDITPYYKTHAREIFKDKASEAPLYDGEYLRTLIRDLTRELTVSQTITNVVVPSFDIKFLLPVIFTKFEGKGRPLKNALLSDALISTSAAPILFPPYYFEVKDKNDPKGLTKTYDMIDGATAANNPTMVALTAVAEEITRGNEDFATFNPVDHGRFLVISLGTAAAKKEFKYNAKDAAKWDTIQWIFPILEFGTQANVVMTDIQACALFKGQAERNYLRIQDDTLEGDVTKIDLATEENMNDLVEIGNKLLQQPLSMINLQTGVMEPVDDGKTTNEQELTRFAKLLSEERKLRLSAA